LLLSSSSIETIRPYREGRLYLTSYSFQVEDDDEDEDEDEDEDDDEDDEGTTGYYCYEANCGGNGIRKCRK
jgi:hypothetical protein